MGNGDEAQNISARLAQHLTAVCLTAVKTPGFSRPQKNASAIDVRITTIYYFNDYATTTALNREVSCSN